MTIFCKADCIHCLNGICVREIISINEVKECEFYKRAQIDWSKPPWERARKNTKQEGKKQHENNASKC